MSNIIYINNFKRLLIFAAVSGCLLPNSFFVGKGRPWSDVSRSQRALKNSSTNYDLF